MQSNKHANGMHNHNGMFVILITSETIYIAFLTFSFYYSYSIIQPQK